MFTGLVKDDILEAIAMHDFRKNPGRSPRQALDGFLNAPSRQQVPVNRPEGRKALHLDGLRSSGRRVDDFRRTEGYHAAQPIATTRTELGPRPLPKIIKKPST